MLTTSKFCIVVFVKEILSEPDLLANTVQYQCDNLKKMTWKVVQYFDLIFTLFKSEFLFLQMVLEKQFLSRKISFEGDFAEISIGTDF